VTQKQWEAVMGTNPSHFKGANRPVEHVSWKECVGFAQRFNIAVPSLGAALPTEAQWEYSCRAGSPSAFNDGSPCTQPEGDDPALSGLGWFDKNSEGQTRDVKLKRHNAWGLHDMHGNVWEWCRDGLRIYTTEPQRDPVGPMEESAHRALRGGSWYYQAQHCRAAIRGGNLPGHDWRDTGFRLFAGQEPVAAEPPGAERPSGPAA
jgi:formylglycine-generating enzyme required for sulfatase activity